MTYAQYDPGEDAEFADRCDRDPWTFELFGHLSSHITAQRVVTEKELQLRGVDRHLILASGKVVNVEIKYDRNPPMNFALEYWVRGGPGVFTKPDQLTDLFTYIFWHEQAELREYYMWRWDALKRWWDENEKGLIGMGARDGRNAGCPFRCYFVPVSSLTMYVPPMYCSAISSLDFRLKYAREKFAQRLKGL